MCFLRPVLRLDYLKHRDIPKKSSKKKMLIVPQSLVLTQTELKKIMPFYDIKPYDNATNDCM